MFREREANRSEDVSRVIYLCPSLPLHDDDEQVGEEERIEFWSDSIEWSPPLLLHLHQSSLSSSLGIDFQMNKNDLYRHILITIRSLPSTDSSSSWIPVLLLITGDSVLFGSGNLFDPSVLSFHENIMVITANFRLGLFGEYSLVFSPLRVFLANSHSIVTTNVLFIWWWNKKNVFSIKAESHPCWVSCNHFNVM